MTTSHQPQKRKQPDTDSTVQREDDVNIAQSLSSQNEILHLQRTIGNRATIQRLKKNTLERLPDEDNETENDAELIRSGHSMEMQRVIQRKPLISGDDMLAVAPYTTNIFGRKKNSLYNTLVDALKGYEDFLGKKDKTIDTLKAKLTAIENAAQAWVTKHGESKKANEVAKIAKIKETLASATQIKADVQKAKNDLNDKTETVELMYANPDLWARITEWSRTRWLVDDNLHFYESYRTFTTVQQGKDIIAKHLLFKATAGKPVSPELFNVNDGLFNRAAALFVKPDAQVTVAELKTFFGEVNKDGVGIWNDVQGKARNDNPAGRDTFPFLYVVSKVPDIMGLG